MDLVVASGPMRMAPAASLVLGAAGLLLGAVLFFSDGSSDTRLFPVGTAVLLVAAGGVAAALAGLVPRPMLGRRGFAFLALLAAFTVWSGISVRWSIAPDASWAYFNRDLVYLAFACLGVIVGAAVPRPQRVIAVGLAVLLALVLGWALLGKVVPSLFPDGARNARLREPIAYWNGLALLGVIALLLALWLATCRAFRPLVRAAGVVLAYAAIVATVLTYSRAGIGLAVLAAIAWVALSGRAFDSVVALALAGAAAVGVSAFALSLSGVADDGQSYATRSHDGRLFGVVFVAVGVGLFGFAVAAAGSRVPGPRAQRLVVSGAAGAVVVAVVAVLAATIVRAGGPGEWLDARWHDFARPQTIGIANAPSRLGSLSSNFRWDWWQEAWRGFRDAPLTGQGAGSFYRLHRLERTQDIGVSEPHNVPLQVLSDTGIVGFLLLVGALAGGAAAAVSTIRRLDGVDRAAGLALGLGACAYFVHWLVDFDWEFVAVTGPVLFVLGALAPEGAAERARAQRLWAVAAAAIALVGVSSLFAPWFSEQKIDDAYAAIGRFRPAQAAADARDAHRLNPLSIDPLLVWGLAETEGRNWQAAYDRYREAVDLQPKNADAWFALGSFELKVLHQPRIAYPHLLRARDLDRFAAQGRLDELIAEAQRQANS